MPHTKRKAKTRPPSDVINTEGGQKTVLEWLDPQILPGGLAAVGESLERGAAPLAIEASISSGAPTPPPPPAREGVATPIQAGVCQIDIFNSPEAENGIVQSKGISEIEKIFRPQGSFLQSPPKEYSTPKEDKSDKDKKEGIKVVIDHEKVLKKPTCITLETLWNCMVKLDSSINRLTEVVMQTSTSSVSNTAELQQQKKDLSVLEKRVLQTEKIQTQQIVSGEDVNKRLEVLENTVRSLNLRVNNFPIIRKMNPIELFRAYLIQILKIPKKCLPVIIKAYYLGGKMRKMNKLDQNQKQEADKEQEEVSNSIDLSELLQKSQDEIVIKSRGLLLVQLAFSTDKDLVMRSFFQNRSSTYYGEKIWIFPDLIKITQIRRENFLQYRGKVLEKGGYFNLKYPCRCIIKLNGNNYSFTDPVGLKDLLAM
ncbi:uncharacterized protein LOC115093793 [Rhinatrema bivittatum]|uniref:uncharacterized protein LOC115093793 n=1 Tax=Rhinatrema bivittatum TaxID=194408 RepID=UPI00112DC898|nr:uncharacterized protein LOC115093793 [Rhinatrema bivittatum]